LVIISIPPLNSKFTIFFHIQLLRYYKIGIVNTASSGMIPIWSRYTVCIHYHLVIGLTFGPILFGQIKFFCYFFIFRYCSTNYKDQIYQKNDQSKSLEIYIFLAGWFKIFPG
jgi:hypothetical protein